MTNCYWALSTYILFVKLLAIILNPNQIVNNTQMLFRNNSYFYTFFIQRLL
ncbi:hypothetical protein BACI71_120188 [Bacillus mycoides]|uniref:Uncharacterized protein n=1 Tax=Bacillus mycoides TaxID=1405 RepID=A0A653SRK2_BACMY|nr:hypothetical protein BACI71_120188 [Bacillus mycoides]